MTALNQAYASNSATPLNTIEFIHSSLTGGELRLVQAKYDLDATLEDASNATFTAAAIRIQLPSRSTDGRQDLEFVVSNINNVAWQQLSLALEANRTTEEKIICKYRAFLEADLSAPAGAVYTFTVNGTITNRRSISFRAGYTPLPDTQFPRYRYYPTLYPGLKYI